MARNFRLAVIVIMVVSNAGCWVFDIGSRGGPAYELDTGRIGTGEPAIELRNDHAYDNGQPVDYRHK